MQCKNCGSHMTDGAWICPACSYDHSKTARRSHRAGLYADLPVLPMRWFAFLINFLLFIFSVICAVMGIVLLFGGAYEVYIGFSAEIIYETCPSMQHLDIAIGCGMLVCSLLYLLARFRLAGFCKGAPHLFCTTLILSAALCVARLIGMYSLLPEEFLSSAEVTHTITAFAPTAVLLVLNTVYFKKRIPYFSR